MSLGVILTSIRGKRLGLTSSGGLTFQPTSSTGMAHAAEISTAGVFNSSVTSFRSTVGTLEIATLKSLVETISSSAATMLGYGVSVISSDVINVSVLKLSAPVAGVYKEIIGQSSASTISFNTTSSDITFSSSLAGSSAYVFDTLGGIHNAAVVFRGLSSTRWAKVT